jgi:negative regulator of sigma E activity
MRQDPDILEELFLPYLTEVATHAPALAAAMADRNTFRDRLRDVLTGSDERLSDLVTAYEIRKASDVTAHLMDLKKQYFVYLAQCYCNGVVFPATTTLLEYADIAFAEEVSFQQDLITAIRQAGRAEIREELLATNEIDGADLSDNDIKTAFHLQQKEATRHDLRKQLQQWETEEPTINASPKRKRRVALPLLFLRLAAAAAVSTVATVGVVRLYNSDKEKTARTTQHKADTTQIYNQEIVATTDTNLNAEKDEQNKVTNTVNPIHEEAVTGKNKADKVNKNGTNSAADSSYRQPHIVLRGTIIDKTTNEIVTGVTVNMEDEKGNRQSVFSADGTFSFELPLHHDLVITGTKEKYISARLSLSTKDVKSTDADEVIEGTLRLTKDQ